MATSTYKPPAANFSLEDRKRLCNEWAKSNLSRSEFIRKRKLPKSFHNWCYKFLPTEQPADNGIDDQEHWLQVVPQEENKTNLSVAEQIETDLMQVNLHCNGLRFNFKMPMEQIITFIKELNHATTIIR